MADWPDGIDMDALLAPTAGDAPSGVDLREDPSSNSLYRRLKNARQEAGAAERLEEQGSRDPAAEPLAVLWRQVRGLALQALGQSKDLDVAAWLLEALLRSDGPAGLAAGAQLIGGLAEAFWERNLYPLPDEDGMSTRVNLVSGLNGTGGRDGTLAQPLRKLVLFERPDGAPFAFWQYKQSQDLQTLQAARAAQRTQGGAVPFAAMEAEARAAGGAHFATLRRDLRAARDAWVAMAAVLDAKAEADAPSTSAVRDLLDELLTAASRFAPAEAAEAQAAEASAPSAAGGDSRDAAEGAGQAAGPLVGVVSREDMLRDLTRIAAFFRRTEPQSPLAYTLEEAIRRGRMTWPELLAEIVSDISVRDNILMQLGIRPPQPTEGDAEGGGGSGSSW